MSKKIGFEYNLNNDIGNWYSLISNLSVIKLNNVYFYYKDGQWLSFEELNKSNIENLGFSVSEINDSIIRELVGENTFDIVTWTDEIGAERKLNGNITPPSQNIVYADYFNGKISNVISTDTNVSYLISHDNESWFTWNGDNFVLYNDYESPISSSTLNNLTKEQWGKWQFNKTYIKPIIDEGSSFASLKVNINEAIHTHEVEKMNFYILNTSARISMSLLGGRLTGILSDDDLSRVQYRVFLNNEAFFPSNGEFTELSPSPLNIELTIPSSKVIMDDSNFIKVEFQDFFGKADYWETEFIGSYTGLMFKDVYDEYFSTEIGEVLKQLDFGTLVAGETSIEHEIILKNQYGFEIDNVLLYVNTGGLPENVSLEFSETVEPFSAKSELRLSDPLAHDDEVSFLVRLKTEKDAKPNTSGLFNIIARADKKE